MTKKSVSRKPSTNKRPEAPVPEGEVERAAARAGIPPRLSEEQQKQQDLKDRLRFELARDIAPGLVLACDQLSEEIAAIAEGAGGAGNGGDDANVIDALLTLWKLRWELGLTPKHAAQAEEGAS
jgi:hypothetical protein